MNQGEQKYYDDKTALAFYLSFVQNNGNGEGSEQLTQRHKHELGERRGFRQGDAEEPSVRVNSQNAADLREIAYHALDPVLLQARGVFGTALS